MPDSQLRALAIVVTKHRAWSLQTETWVTSYLGTVRRLGRGHVLYATQGEDASKVLADVTRWVESGAPELASFVSRTDG